MALDGGRDRRIEAARGSLGPGGTIADPGLDALNRLVVDECAQVARADGVVVDGDLISAIGEIFGGSSNIASMRQDLLKGKPTEIDYLNGAVVALGEQFGIDCPVNRALVSIIKAMEARKISAR